MVGIDQAFRFDFGLILTFEPFPVHVLVNHHFHFGSSLDYQEACFYIIQSSLCQA